MKRNTLNHLRLASVILLLLFSFHFEIISTNDNSHTKISSNPMKVQKNQQITPQTNLKVTNFVGDGPITINSLELSENYVMKGENAYFTLEIQSSENLIGIILELTIISIDSGYGLTYIQEENNQLKSLTLTATFDDYCSSINSYETNIGYISIGPVIDANTTIRSAVLPLNRGSWKITELSFTYSSGECHYSLTDDLIIHVILNPYQHIIFAYFIHNFVSPFNDGKTIRNSMDAALERLANDYPFNLNIIVIQEDKTWNPKESLLNCSDLIDDACKHIGDKLDLKNNVWDKVVEYDLENDIWTQTKNTNGGYDIFVATSDRLSDTLGLASYGGNLAYTGSGRYNLLNYRISESQYDNLLQHEISHIFCANDHDGSNSIMDTALTFNGTHFTSPCLEQLHYISLDISYMQKHSSRFDGSANPMVPLTYGKETLLSSTENIFWVSPKLAIPDNISYPVKYSIAGLKNSIGKISLYYNIYQAGSWNNFQVLTSTENNITDYDLFADNSGNLHVSWVLQNLTDNSHSIFYRKYSYASSWGSIEKIGNGSNCNGISITGDYSGKIHLLYSLINESTLEIFYAVRDSAWNIGKYPNSGENSFLPIISSDNYNNIHFLWVENNTSTNHYKLMYQTYTNESSFNSVEEIYTTSNLNHIINPQVDHSDDSSLIGIKWEVINEQLSSIYYIEKKTSGNFSEFVTLHTKPQLKTFNSQMLIAKNEEVHIWWEQPNKWTNKTYILFKNKQPEGEWYFTNRYTIPEYNYYHIDIVNGQEETLQLIYVKIDQSILSTTKVCRLYSRILYTTKHQIFVSNFTFEANLHPQLYIEFSGIEAQSSFSDIGKLDMYSKAKFHGFGIWRSDDGVPLIKASLALDYASGNWSGSGIIDNPQPGIYYVGVSFRDENYISSGNIYSTNIFTIEVPETPPIPSNKLALILGLSIGIPTVILGATIPTVIIFFKKRKNEN